MENYVSGIVENIKKRYPWEKEFIQAVTEVMETVAPVIKQVPKYKKERILERMTEPERVIMFRVPWHDDKGELQINRGYRVQFNSAIGPYKGGLRFHSTVTLSVLKFLGFEQVFKNSLTGLPMGGGKGGSDFDLRGKSKLEVMRFCQSFMTELYRHIGPDTDVPAGDIGVGGREIGYLYGQYKRISNSFESILTGKGQNWGGSLIRPEATGFGAVYFAKEMLATKNESFDGKRVALSGFGNVAWGAAQKVNELGGKVVTLSGPDGYIYDPDGIKDDKIDYMLEMRASGNDRVEDYANEFGVEFHSGKRPWEVKVDVAMPCACENELRSEDAKMLIDNGCICVTEGANMPTTLDATKMFIAAGILFAPGKAANAGGVACSGLEMSQNSMRIKWTAKEVDTKLHEIMVNIHNNCIEASKRYGFTGNYVAGANIAGFVKVADSMIEQGFV